MPRLPSKDVPKQIRPYHFHGLDYDGSGKNVYADCPFCDGSGKLSIEVASGFWRCLSCHIAPDGKTVSTGGGNVTDFLKVLHRESLEATLEGEYTALAEQRGILYPETLKGWQLCKSLITGEWLIPGYSTNGEVGNLYRWTGKLALATTDQDHRLHGYNLWDDNKEYVDWLEGPWDGMAFYETVIRCMVVGDTFMPTDPSSSSTIGANSNVLAVPGSGVFLKTWANLCNGKHVRLWYDNDHPKKHPRTDEMLPPNGLAAMKRVAGVIGCNSNPLTIHFCKWGDDSYEGLTGFNNNLPQGYDVRDMLNA